MSKELDDLVAKVKPITSFSQSVSTFIQGIRQQIIDAGANSAKLKELTDSLSTSETAIVQALVANTPAANTP